jgi:hypothetical protein
LLYGSDKSSTLTNYNKERIMAYPEDFEIRPLMKDKKIFRLFQMYCKKRVATDDLKFLMALELNKSEDFLIANFIADEAPYELNHSKRREARDAQGNVGIFYKKVGELEKECTNQLKQNLWIGFIKSELLVNHKMDDDKRDDKILKALKKINDQKKYEGGKLWKEVKENKKLENLEEALKDEDFSDFIKAWKELRDSADDYIKNHKTAALFGSSDRVSMLQDCKDYYEDLAKEMKKYGNNIDDFDKDMGT